MSYNPESDEGPQARSRYDAQTMPDGSIEVSVWTNDNDDTGYPNEAATWTQKYRNREDFARSVGVSRVGVSGTHVTVVLDGEEQTRHIKRDPPQRDGLNL